MQAKIKLRAITATLLMIVFATTITTGVGLFLSPRGKLARDVGWTFLSMTKTTLGKVHTISGFLLGFLVIIHLILNWDMYVSEMKMLFSK